MGAPRQPDDAWSFLRGGVDDESEGPVAAEEDAVHPLEDSTLLGDPARNDMAAMVDGDGTNPDGSDPMATGTVTARWFGDEEPELDGADPDRGSGEDDEHEPDLEEILESQHYAFDRSEEDDPT